MKPINWIKIKRTWNVVKSSKVLSMSLIIYQHRSLWDEEIYASEATESLNRNKDL